MNLYKFHTNPEKLDLHDEAHESVPKLVWEKYKNNQEELKKREKILAKDPKTAYEYARRILKGPFPAGEAAIAKNANLAYEYARYEIKKPFPAGEAVISKDHETAYEYALYVLKLSATKAKKWRKLDKNEPL